MTKHLLVYDPALIKHVSVFGSKGNRRYSVLMFPDGKLHCFCAAFSYNKKDCWHVRVVRLAMAKKAFLANTVTVQAMQQAILKRDNETLEHLLINFVGDIEGVYLGTLFELGENNANS